MRSSLTRVVGVILRREGKALLCLRTRGRKSYPAVWDIPGGHVEKFESLCDALTRELEEELGIRAHPDSAEPWAVHRIGETELSVFIVDRWNGEPHNRAPEEHDEVRWISIVQLASLPLAHPSFQQLLTRALMNMPSDG